MDTMDNPPRLDPEKWGGVFKQLINDLYWTEKVEGRRTPKFQSLLQIFNKSRPIVQKMIKGLTLTSTECIILCEALKDFKPYYKKEMQASW